MTEATITKEQLCILQHSLGLDQYGQGRQYRNHYVAGPGHHSYSDLLELVTLSYMKERPATAISGGNPWFSVTREGIDAVAQFSPAPPPPPKVNRAQKRYRDHLSYDGGLTFAESLGITVPRVDTQDIWFHGAMKDGQWVSGHYKTMHRYQRITRHYWGQDVIEGEWMPTKKEAKASYKAALAARKEREAA